jgi:hypothetical protein
MIEKGSEEDTPSPKIFSEGAKWFEIAIAYLPTLLKLLATLGLLKTARASFQARQNLQARKAAKTAAMLARAEQRSRWV